MKKYILILLSIFIFTYTNAQENNTSVFNNLSFGVTGGVNLSNFFGDVSSDNSFLVGLHVGGIVKAPISEKFLLQLEPAYSLEGYKFASDRKYRVSFINLPVLVRLLKTGDLSVEAGPKIAIRLSEKVDLVNGGSRSLDRVKTIWFGLVAGTSYAIDDNWAARFRFNYTPSDIIRSDAGDTEGTSSIVFQFGLAYFFN